MCWRPWTTSLLCGNLGPLVCEKVLNGYLLLLHEWLPVLLLLLVS